MRVHLAPPSGVAGRGVALVNRIILVMSQLKQKKLRRVPHVFSKVIELSLSSDADVGIREDRGGFQFTVAVNSVLDGICAHAVDVYPGVTKVIIGDASEDPDRYVDDLEIDRWRFRLPDDMRPELATAAYVDGDLVVVVLRGWGG